MIELVTDRRGDWQAWRTDSSKSTGEPHYENLIQLEIGELMRGFLPHEGSKGQQTFQLDYNRMAF
jgi:hypothetical protein